MIAPSARQTSRDRRPSLILLTGLALTAGATPLPCSAIEMFTFFGDGSRIGLPSLEVPVEAYPGIPLRSDRLRARRAGRRTQDVSVPTGGSGVAGATPLPIIPESTAPDPGAAAAGSRTAPASERARQSPTAPAPPPEAIPTPSARGAAVLNRQHPS